MNLVDLVTKREEELKMRFQFGTVVLAGKVVKTVAPKKEADWGEAKRLAVELMELSKRQYVAIKDLRMDMGTVIAEATGK